MKKQFSTWIFFAAIAAALLAIQIYPAGFSDPDGYYHVQMARLLTQGNFLASFPWLSATTWSQYFADLHFLYHLLLIPFITISPIVGAQIFNALAGTAFAWLLYKILKDNNISYPKFWTLLGIFASPGFLLRLSLIKAIPVSLIMIALFIFFLFRGKKWPLFFVGWIYVWAYGGFIYLPMLLAVWLVSNIILKITYNKLLQINWPIILFPLLGIIAGIILRPQVKDFAFHLYYQLALSSISHKIPAGSEWQAPGLMVLVKSTVLILMFWLAGLLVLLKNPRLQLSQKKLFLFISSLGFFILAMQSYRFVELAVPFLLLFAAFAMEPVLARFSWDKNEPPRSKLRGIKWIPDILSDALKDSGTTELTPRSKLRGILSIKNRLGGGLFGKFPIFAGGLACVSIFTASAMLVRAEISGGVPLENFRGAAEFLKHNSQNGDIVFNSLWDRFPEMFYLDDKNYYVTGMDPRFLYARSQESYWLWRHISYDDEQVCEQPTCDKKNSRDIITAIKNQFHAKYIFLTPKTNPRLTQYLQNIKGIGQAYADENYEVYKLE